MGRYAAWFPVVLLAALAAVTAWLERQVQPPEPARDAKSRHDPDYIVEKLNVTRFGPDGAARYVLNARRMTHYPDDDTTFLEVPKLVHYGQHGIKVTATARQATVSSNGQDAYLTDNVQVVRSAYADKSELKVETTYLHVIPEDNVVETDKLVKISDANTLITSVGLEFNNETRILHLLSRVRGTYEKPRPARR